MRGTKKTKKLLGQQALRESEAKFRALTESAATAIVIIQDDGLCYANPAAETISGYTNEELLSVSFEELIHPDLREIIVQRVLARQRGDNVPQRYEAKIVTKSGEERWVDVTARSFRYQGRPAVLGTAFDITDLKRAEEGLRRASETFRAVVQASPLAILAMDLEGDVTFWNPTAEKIFGWTEQETLGRKLPFIRPDEAGDVVSLLERCLAGEAFVGLERRWQRKDGTPVDISIWTAPLRDAAGSITGTIGLAVDVTDRKLLERQLRQAQKMEAVGRLAGGVAHDFNNLLTVILGYGQMLRQRLSDEDPMAGEVGEILKAADQAAALTSQLLAFSRRQIVQPRRLDLNTLVSDMDRLLRRVIGEHIELVVALSPGLGLINADQGQIEQVILNLAVNARDAMPQGGRITIETQNVDLGGDSARDRPGARPGSYVMLAVSDTGAGMDVVTQSRLFEPFFTTKELGKGTGLGLSTVYGIVKQTGGNIYVFSEPGRGTTFKVYLPRLEEGVERTAPCGAPAALRRGSETILLVEDEPGVRRLATEALQRQGYAVLEAESGSEALRICGRHKGPVHLLLTDVVMPGMSGRELAARLAAARRELKVLYMSGYTEDTIVHHGVLDPGTPFLPKPFKPEMLARRVREVLDAR